jgi:hypothetical protein
MGRGPMGPVRPGARLGVAHPAVARQEVVRQGLVVGQVLVRLAREVRLAVARPGSEAR